MPRHGVSLVITFSLVVSMAPAALADFGYRDSGTDPDDVTIVDSFDVDIRGSTRKVWQDARGRRWFSVTIRMYETPGPSYGLSVPLDSRGGPFREATLDITNFAGPPRCALTWEADSKWWRNRARYEDERVTCRFLHRRLKPNKHIRWRVRSPTPILDQEAPLDLAPDKGWYE